MLTDPAAADLFIAALAREMHDEERVFVGSNQTDVALAAFLARRLWAPRLRFWASGQAQVDGTQDLAMVGRRSYDNALVANRGSTFWQARAFDDALRAPVVFAGGLQVDGRGNANLAGIRDGDGWRLRGPGSAGLPSLTAFAARFYIMVASHEPRTLVDACSVVSVLGDPVARAAAGLPRDSLAAVITPLARFTPTDEGLRLSELAPGVHADELARRTGFPIRVAAEVRRRAPLTDEEAAALAVLRSAMARNAGSDS